MFVLKMRPIPHKFDQWTGEMSFILYIWKYIETGLSSHVVLLLKKIKDVRRLMDEL